VGGEAVSAVVRDGALRLPAVLVAGTVIELELDMPAQVLTGNARIDAVRGAVAVRRGPIVYCLEQADNDVDIDEVEVDPARPLAAGQAATPLGPVLVATAARRAPDGALYSAWQARPEASDRPIALTLRPYATWGNGTAGAMRVWIPASTG
jgi:DUF1680 family protein